MRINITEELEKIEDISKDYTKILSNLYYTHYWLLDKYKMILKDFGIGPQQSNVLGIVKHFHPQPLTLGEIKSMLLEKNADASRIVERLKEKKFLSKVTDPNNRRKVGITLTPQGLEMIQALEKKQAFKKFTQKFSLEDARQFARLLAKLRTED